jgi:hypothetical protein
MGAITRIRNNQVYNADIHASKIVPYTIDGTRLANNIFYNSTLTVSNLAVVGNSTFLDANITVVHDPIISLNRDYDQDYLNYDVGLIFGRGKNNANVALIWHEIGNTFVLQYTTETTQAPTYGNIDFSGYANLAVGTLVANNILGAGGGSLQLGPDIIIPGNLVANTVTANLWANVGGDLFVQNIANVGCVYVANSGINFWDTWGDYQNKLTSDGDGTSYWSQPYYVGPDAPLYPNYGDYWWNTQVGRLLIWVYDGYTEYWFDFLPPLPLNPPTA